MEPLLAIADLIQELTFAITLVNFRKGSKMANVRFDLFVTVDGNTLCVYDLDQVKEQAAAEAVEWYNDVFNGNEDENFSWVAGSVEWKITGEIFDFKIYVCDPFDELEPVSAYNDLWQDMVKRRIARWLVDRERGLYDRMEKKWRGDFKSAPKNSDIDDIPF